MGGLAGEEAAKAERDPGGQQLQRGGDQGVAGIGSRLEANDATAIDTLATRMRTRPNQPASGAGLPGSTSTPTPANPAATPRAVARGTRSPASRRSRTTTSGMAATSTAASPEGTSRSATVTRPVPPARNRRPTRALAPTCRAGTRTPAQPWRASRNGYRTAPASRNRIPEPSSGGIVSTITLIAR